MAEFVPTSVSVPAPPSTTSKPENVADAPPLIVPAFAPESAIVSFDAEPTIVSVPLPPVNASMPEMTPERPVALPVPRFTLTSPASPAYDSVSVPSLPTSEPMPLKAV